MSDNSSKPIKRASSPVEIILIAVRAGALILYLQSSGDLFLGKGRVFSLIAVFGSELGFAANYECDIERIACCSMKFLTLKGENL